MEEKTTRRFEDKGDSDKGGSGEKRGFQRRRGCRFCGEGPQIDFKDRYLLNNFVSERYKIMPSRLSGVSFSSKRNDGSVKRARHIQSCLSYMQGAMRL